MLVGDNLKYAPEPRSLGQRSARSPRVTRTLLEPAQQQPYEQQFRSITERVNAYQAMHDSLPQASTHGRPVPDLTLRDAICSALEHRQADGRRISENWQLRSTRVPNQAGHYRFLNHFHQDDEVIFGNTCLFSPGQMQAVLRDVPNVETVDIAEMRAPDGTQYLHAIAYWLVVRDHFFLVQHVSLQAKAMEEYLTWLLRDQTGTISPHHHVHLQAVFDRNLVGGGLGQHQQR